MLCLRAIPSLPIRWKAINLYLILLSSMWGCRRWHYRKARTCLGKDWRLEVLLSILMLLISLSNDFISVIKVLWMLAFSLTLVRDCSWTK
jgi:hypothetical protein